MAKNNHTYLSCDKQYYSVTFIHTGSKAKVIYTRSVVRIYVKGVQVAVHPRNYKTGSYSTIKELLCSQHRQFF